MQVSASMEQRIEDRVVDAMPDRVHAARARGFSAYLTKPLQIDSALTSIDTALSDRKIII